MSGKRPLQLKSWHTIKDVKAILQQLLHVPMGKQRLFFQGHELGLKGGGGGSPSRGRAASEALPTLRELSRCSHSLQDCGIVRDGETIFFTILSADAGLSEGPILRSYGLVPGPKRLVRHLKQVSAGRRCSRCNVVV
jgi:hypothetical protein